MKKFNYQWKSAISFPPPSYVKAPVMALGRVSEKSLEEILAKFMLIKCNASHPGYKYQYSTGFITHI